MLTNKIITLFAYDEASDKYKSIGTCKAWVFLKRDISKTENGDKNTDTFHIRIPRNEFSHIETGNFVMFCECAGQTPDLAKCRKITRVSDNNFGRCPHWHLEAEG